MPEGLDDATPYSISSSTTESHEQRTKERMEKHWAKVVWSSSCISCEWVCHVYISSCSLRIERAAVSCCAKRMSCAARAGSQQEKKKRKEKSGDDTASTNATVYKKVSPSRYFHAPLPPSRTQDRDIFTAVGLLVPFLKVVMESFLLWRLYEA